MKILFIVPYTPTLIRVRPYALLRTLVRRGHTITLATLWQNEQEHRALGALAALGIEVITQPLSKMRSLWNCAWALPGQAPIQAAYCWQPYFAQQLRQLVAQHSFDLIHVEHLRGVRYALDLKQWVSSTATAVPIVWDSVDCISHLFTQAAEHSRSRAGRLMTKVELARTQRYEEWLLRQFDQILVTSASDRQALLALAVQQSAVTASNTNRKTPREQDQRNAIGSVTVLPNGVDLDGFYQNGVQKAEKTLVFSGKMSYHANVTAALHLVQEIMPQVWASDPTVQVQLVGKDPPAQIRALATGDASNPSEQVLVTGEVPDMQPYLSRATLAVAPLLYGAGIQNKVLEAMACGTPVIASPHASSGLQAKAGRDLLVAHNAADFATSILALLDNPTQRAQIAQDGRAYVEQTHTWDAVGAQLEAIYGKACNRVNRRGQQ